MKLYNGKCNSGDTGSINNFFKLARLCSNSSFGFSGFKKTDFNSNQGYLYGTNYMHILFSIFMRHQTLELSFQNLFAYLVSVSYQGIVTSEPFLDE